MIKFNKVTKIYQPDSIVLQDVSFEIKKENLFLLLEDQEPVKQQL